MAIEATQFKQAMRFWASGVTVLTTQSAELGLQGMTVSAFSSVSAEPPLVLCCLNSDTDTGEGIDISGCFGVNVLSAAQQDVSNQFAGGSSYEARFASTPWHTAVTGAPLLSESLMSLDCTVVEKVRAGSHWILIGEVQHCEAREGDPLLYFNANYRQLAH